MVIGGAGSASWNFTSPEINDDAADGSYIPGTQRWRYGTLYLYLLFQIFMHRQRSQLRLGSVISFHLRNYER